MTKTKTKLRRASKSKLGQVTRSGELEGLPVVDAKKSIDIVVSAIDIRSSRSKAPDKCAAAVACVRQVPQVQEARVHLGRTYLRKDKTWYRFITSGPLRSEIIAFDRGGKFMPGEYRLLRVPESQASGNKPTGPKKKKGNSPLRTAYHITGGVRHSA